MASLKSFIKSVRKAKTIADERNVVQKESASIRTSFKDANLDQNTRRINISKLLYLYIIGEKTHFGQVECIKLLASPKFIDKRLGYLATMLLLDENQEVLTLLTNSLDNDMQHPNSYVVGLALCCLGNIASPELARDLYTNVEKLIQSSNSYLKKKACIVASKLIDKNPELAEFFVSKLPDLIGDKYPAVVLASLTLIKAIYNTGDYHQDLVDLAPKLFNVLKKLVTGGYNPDYDILGMNDPFLQLELLNTLRLLSSSEHFRYMETFNDILTQICSNIEIGKNIGHAVLYECIKTIFEINTDQSLKILGINLLGKFLTTKDNNTRYVALNTLLTVVNIEPAAVQRHRSIIVSCLNDGDISIRRRSLELTFAILNETNIRVLIKEILKYLISTDDNELKPFIISQLILCLGKYSPNDSWKFDNLIKVLNHSGNFIKLEYISDIIGNLIRLPNDLKKSIILKLIESNLADKDQYGMSLVIIWCIGEYFDLIKGETLGTTTLNESTVIDLFTAIHNNSSYSKPESEQLTNYILTAFIKLSVKFTDSKTLEDIRIWLNDNSSSTDLEIQIRSIEFSQILTSNLKIKKGLLSKMPPPSAKQKEMLSLTEKSSNLPVKKHHQRHNVEHNDLVDLNDNKNDLLADIFDTAKPPAPKSNNDILDLFDLPSSPAPDATATAKLPPNSVEAYKDSVLTVNFISKTIGNGQANIESQISTTKSITNLQFLIAVPKSQKLTISTNSNTNMSLVSPQDLIVQNIKLTGNPGSKIKFRIKISYDGFQHQFDYNFNSTL